MGTTRYKSLHDPLCVWRPEIGCHCDRLYGSILVIAVIVAGENSLRLEFPISFGGTLFARLTSLRLCLYYTNLHTQT